MKRIKLPKGRYKRISWKKLAEIHKFDIEKCYEIYLEKFNLTTYDNRPLAEGCKCPIGLRDLEDDACYLGNSLHKCKYFVKYDFDEKGNIYIICKFKNLYIEGSLF